VTLTSRGPAGGPAALPGSEAVEDYVRAILRTARGPRRVASTTEVAECLGVTPASVSSMFKKLARLELVVYVPYHGVTLTPAGAELALRLTRRHHLLEAFLIESVGMAPQLVHEEADRLEHHISPELERLIAARLGHSLHDPRGEPIPAADPSLRADDTLPLADVGAGQAAQIAGVPDANPAVVRYLFDRARVAPGTRVVVLENHPFDGPLVMAVGPRQVVLDRALAAALRVRLVGPSGAEVVRQPSAVAGSAKRSA
jgi:DtxR family transcriptional regulator, Mn-dependent transcriptional regulator